jgi:hypothetical protein
MSYASSDSSKSVSNKASLLPLLPLLPWVWRGWLGLPGVSPGGVLGNEAEHPAVPLPLQEGALSAQALQALQAAAQKKR